MKTVFNFKKHLKQKSLLLLLAIGLFSCGKKENNEATNTQSIPVKGQLEAELTSPPFVPKPVGDREATKLVVNMEIKEQEGEMVDGTKYTYWTFGGSVTGSFIRTRVGDEVEFHLKNHPDNKLPHNIDLHAVTGPGGGATSSLVAPGHEKVFSFNIIGSDCIIVPR